MGLSIGEAGMTRANISFVDDPGIKEVKCYATEVLPTALRTWQYDRNVCYNGLDNPQVQSVEPGALSEAEEAAFSQRWETIEAHQRRANSGTIAVRSLLDERVLSRTFGSEPAHLDVLKRSLERIREIVDSGTQEVGIATRNTNFLLALSGSFSVYKYGDSRPGVVTELCRGGEFVTLIEPHKSFNIALRSFDKLWEDDDAVLTQPKAVVRHLGAIIRDVNNY